MKTLTASLALGLALLCPLFAVDKEKPKALKAQKPAPTYPPLPGSAADQKVVIDALAYIDRVSATKALGLDPGENIIVVQIKFKLAPGAEKVLLNRDDFLLRSDRNGQTSRPLEAAQIAGGSVMVISSRGGSQGTPMSEQRRVPYGVPGIPGGGPGGVPSTMPMPNESPNVGAATADTSEAQASIEQRGKTNTPLYDALQKKVLPDGEIDKEVSGLLYFQIEGKQRPKDLELVYRKAPPRLSIRFTDPTKKK